jgi:hypothetical protein
MTEKPLDNCVSPAKGPILAPAAEAPPQVYQVWKPEQA